LYEPIWFKIIFFFKKCFPEQESISSNNVFKKGYLVFFLAICTQPHGIYGERMKCEMTRQGDLRKRYFIQTVNTIAYRTNEMDMLVMMVVFGTVRSTDGIGCCTIQIEYFMYNS